MNDGPFREPQEPAQPPGGRARYGGLSPLVEQMGQPKKSSDPYFTPPQDGGGRGRGTPYLDPPPFKPGGDPQPPAGQPTPQPGQDVRPPEQPKWQPPAGTPNWNSPQPYGGDQSGQGLQQAVGSKSRQLVEARDLQRGSTTGKAIIAGTSAGLITEPLVKGLGIAAERGSQVQGESLFARGTRATSNLWKGQFDPIGIHSSQIAKEESLIAKSFEGIKATHQMDQKLLQRLQAGTKLEAAEAKHLASLREGLKLSDNTKVVEVLMERQQHFNPNALKALNAAETGDHIAKIKALESSGGARILTAAERGMLETRQLALQNMGKLEIASKGAAAETKWFTAAGAWENAKRSFLYTAGTGVVLSTDHSVRDRMYGKDAPSWETTSMTVPLSIALGKGFKGKAALTALSVIGGHVVDNNSPITPWVPESFKHFTAFDAVPLGVAFAIPSKGKLARTGLIGTAVLAGNAAESAFSRPSAGDIEQQAVNTASNDKSERSFSSFEKAVQGYRELGRKNEIVLEQNLAQVLVESNKNYSTMSQEEKLAAHRQTAALARSLGEHRLENGTRLSAGSTDRPTYILDGLNLDMGGDALTFLQMARNSVKGSRAMTEILMDKQAFGTRVSQQELQDLDKVGNKVDAGINSILGKHDIQKAMDKLKAFIERGTTSSGATLNKELAFHKTFVEDINKKLGRNMPQLRMQNGELNPDAATIVGKLLRDQALAKLAHAAYKLDHGNDPIGAGQMIFGTPQGRNEWLPGTQSPKGFDGALEALMLAERLAPSNPDLPELKAIAQRLADQVKAKAPDQYGNHRSNPLGTRPIGQ